MTVLIFLFFVFLGLGAWRKTAKSITPIIASTRISKNPAITITFPVVVYISINKYSNFESKQANVNTRMLPDRPVNDKNFYQ